MFITRVPNLLPCEQCYTILILLYPILELPNVEIVWHFCCDNKCLHFQHSSKVPSEGESRSPLVALEQIATYAISRLLKSFETALYIEKHISPEVPEQLQ